MSPSKRKIVAVTVGIALACVPIAGFSLWLDIVIDQQGGAEVRRAADHTVALANQRTARVIEQLDALSRRGVDSCEPDDIAALREATFATTPIKELSVVGPDGRTLCTDLGLPLGERRVLASQPITPSASVWVDVIHVSTPATERQTDNMVRLRLWQQPNGNALAALVPSEMFVPEGSALDSPSGTHTRLTAGDRVTLAETGASNSPTATAGDRFAVSLPSRRYNLAATVSLPKSLVAARYEDLRKQGLAITAGIAIALVAFALLITKRQRANPIADLERALEAGEFVPYYQPIVDIKSGGLRGCEVLMRWRKPDGTLVLPGSFIPLAESSELIVDMTRALMRRVCKDLGGICASRPQLLVGFNIAARHFADDTIIHDICTVFDGSSMRRSQMVLELTERQPIANLTATRQVIAALQGLGAKIAIDDAGTGHGGLSYMLKLGVDIIKIDKMFIDAIGTEANSTAIIESLIDLAVSMRMEIVAEGVETFEQVALLRDLGVRGVQGYVFAPPLPASSFVELVEAIDPRPTREEPGSTSATAPQHRILGPLRA